MADQEAQAASLQGATAAEKALHAAALAEEQERHEAEVGRLKAASEDRVREERARHEAEVAHHVAVLAQTKADHDAYIAKVTADLEAKHAAAGELAERCYSDLQLTVENHERMLDEKWEAHAAEVDRNQREEKDRHAKIVASLQEAHDADIAAERKNSDAEKVRSNQFG